MSYCKSRVRKAFEDQIRLSLAEVRPLHRHAQKSGVGGATHLLGAYYVLAFAQLELYVKGFVEDTVAMMSASGPNFDKWPDLMVAYYIHRSQSLGLNYRKFGNDDDEHALLDGLSRVARDLAVWSRGGGSPSVPSAGEFLDKKGYPSARNLPQLFRRLGVRDIWGVISAEGRINSRLVLTSLNDLRTQIAHEGSVPPGFGLSDFRSRIKQMHDFVAALDRGFAKHFCAHVMSRQSWNNGMVHI